MKRIAFTKVVGSGNDFVLLDARGRSGACDWKGLARFLCDRKQAIGADGLLVLADSKKGTARMRIFNPDGSEAAMCGNGLRCAAWYLYTRDHGQRRLAIETGAGLLCAEVKGRQRVRVFLGEPKNFKFKINLFIAGRSHCLHSVNTGVPHAVIPVRDLKAVDLARLGPLIRHHRLFGSAGTNVDFIQVTSPHRVSIRTYERGVEAETLACGTGAVAAVVVGQGLGLLRPPAVVRTASGEQLRVGPSGPKSKTGWYLEGKAQVVFQGELLP